MSISTTPPTHGEQYGMNVSLAARLGDGREIAGDVFGFAGPRDGLGAIWHRYRGPLLHENQAEPDRLLEESYHVGMDDVQDAVNEMLGRDPEMHRRRACPGTGFSARSTIRESGSPSSS